MAKAKKEKKVFVLDTSVIIYSHDSIMNFAEHDVAIPITVLEELDQFKKGNDTKNFEAREFTFQKRHQNAFLGLLHCHKSQLLFNEQSRKYNEQSRLIKQRSKTNGKLK